MTSSPGGRRSPAANGNGYESPTEEVQNVLFSSQPSGATTPIRPSLVSRASHMVAMHPTGHTGRTNSSGLNDILAQTEKQVPNGKVSIKDRIACHQWTYFTMTMATGGMANVLYSLNWSSVWILGVGKFFFILNLVLFLINCVLISIRFYIRPGSLTHSFTDQVESLFIPSFVVTIAIIMINTCQYGVPSCGIWLLRTMEIMFWIYVGLSVLTSAGIYLILWSTLVFPVHTMTPTWVFPAYPLLLTAPFASNLIGAAQKTSFSLSINSTAVAFCAVTTQGTGTLIAFMISAAFIYRLMTQKLPRDPQRPGVFMSIGPFGFTASSVAQLGQQASMYIPDDFLGMPHTVAIIQVVSLLVSLWLWGLAFWFFIVSVGSLWKYVRVGSHLPFQMTWWSFVFPNTALVTATGVIGGVFKSKGLDIFASVMTAFLVIVWAYVFITMLRGLKRRKLMWPKNNS